MRPATWSLVLAGLAACAGRSAAQTPEPIRAMPPWMSGWSPLVRLADIGRRLPGTPAFSDVLAAPPPRIGLFWTAGIPVGVGADVIEPRLEARAGRVGGHGPFRRALDVDADGASRVTGVGWRPVGRGAVAGRVIAALRAVDAAGHAAMLDPHRSDPFVLADSALPAMRRLQAQLEGAAAWRLGRLDAGFAAGIAVDDYRTQEARFPRLGRASLPALGAGLAIRLPLALRAAVHARWTGGAETWILSAQPGVGEVYRLAGYSDPTRAVVQPPLFAFRRADREANAFGGGLEGRLLGARWVVHARRERRTNSYMSTRDVNPPTDRWRARGWTVGAAIQARVPGDAFLLTAQTRSRTVTGEGRRSDLEGIFFRAKEQIVESSAELWYRPRGGAWRGAAAFHLRRENMQRRDFIVDVYTDIQSWTIAGRLEIARDFGRVSAGVGLAVAGYTPSAAIPDPAAMGPLYQQLVAQENSLYVLPSLPYSARLGLAWNANANTTVAVDAARERVTRRGSAIDVAFAPTGAYTRWAVELRVVMSR